MLQKTVPDPYSGDWKSSVAVGWDAGTENRQFTKRSERRRFRNSDSAAWRSSSARYDGARPDRNRKWPRNPRKAGGCGGNGLWKRLSLKPRVKQRSRDRQWERRRWGKIWQQWTTKIWSTRDRWRVIVIRFTQ